MTNGLRIKKEEFKKIPSPERDWIIYDNIASQDKRIEKLEKGRKVDKTVSALGGFVGGIVAVIGKALFLK